jgi:ATP adenylyltransferase
MQTETGKIPFDAIPFLVYNSGWYSGKEDGMEHIWAPWRMAYIESEKSGACILCAEPAAGDDDKNFILYRGDNNFVMLNLYPYNPYHLMVAPFRHVASIEDLSGEERHEHFDMVSRCVGVLKEEINPTGFNIGINMGAVAGAGISDHVHTHIVPRWQGDTNFVTVVSDIRIVPQALADSYNKLKGKF